MKATVQHKRVFNIELSEDEMSIIAGALYNCESGLVQDYINKYNYPCRNDDDIVHTLETLSEEFNLAIENMK
jgi:hypothetical protein